ncbi:hypothetical protein [Acinetobacter bereziniae]|uniref:hypothetical protein n=1 Tax=Acinetobacter bereziniae TaxID=106648 RepID=UPI0005748EF7|nr:hypothetical protein [Acinetobacter bereziniae]MBO3656371.1 hypothetical protein [Acinetobacter bereziniae]CEI52218.1 hypothetical protein [Acinetobacter bereziniae]
MMKKVQKTKALSFVVLASILVSACGGNSSNSDSSGGTNNQGNTKNDVVFPVSWFAMENSYDFKTGVNSHYIIGLKLNLKENNQIIGQTIIPFKQATVESTYTIDDTDFHLTKNKLYSSENGILKKYLIDKKYPYLTYSFDVNNKTAKETLEYKTISLANQSVTSDLVSRRIFEDYEDDSAENLKKSFQKLNKTFTADAVCYQYQTTKSDEPYIEFNRDDRVFINNNIETNSLSEWMNAKEKLNLTVKTETWAGLKIAYILNSNGTIDTDEDIVIEMDNKLYNGDYTDTQVHRVDDAKDNVCSLYNESATNTLISAFELLPK